MGSSKACEGDLIGGSEAIQWVDADVSLAAKCDATVLFTGEGGVGKQRAARLIHQRSMRRAGRFVTINCAGIPDVLLESELFGHVRGGFPGALHTKTGLLETASNGTLFMNEIGAMSVRMQTVLLRFLETAEIRRVGAERAHARANVRLITATTRVLPDRIASGAFLSDLYFRLNVIRIDMPPLRERVEDLPLLIDSFLSLYSERLQTASPRLSRGAFEALLGYAWPGNVEELKHVIERIVLRAGGREVTAADLPWGAVARGNLACDGRRTFVSRAAVPAAPGSRLATAPRR